MLSAAQQQNTVQTAQNWYRNRYNPTYTTETYTTMANTSPRKPLTHDRQADTAKPEAKLYHLNAGEGLFLEIQPTGSKLWRYRATVAGKRVLLSMGKYPAVSLASAKAQRDEANRLVEQGINPSDQRKADKQEKTAAHAFATIAADWLANREHVTATTRTRETSLLQNSICPAFGHLPVDQVKARHILDMARAIEARGAGDMARRAIQLTGQIMRHAIRQGLAEHDPTTGRLQEALKPRTVNHMARIDRRDLPELLQRIDAYTGDVQTRLGLQLVNLTFVRTKELRFMEWSDLDLSEGVWRIPAEKMKMRMPHIVPLSRQALAILEQLRPLTGQQSHVFYNHSTKKPYSEAFFISALNRMGYKGRMTGHGFRGLASTILHEQGYLHEAIERQLAHTPRDQVSAAYNHAQHLDYRRRMMQEWADYLDTLKDPQVIPFARPASA